MRHAIRGPSEAIRGHQKPSEQPFKRSSEAIGGHQRSSEVIRGHQRSSEVIRGHQRPSEQPSEQPSERSSVMPPLLLFFNRFLAAQRDLLRATNAAPGSNPSCAAIEPTATSSTITSPAAPSPNVRPMEPGLMREAIREATQTQSQAPRAAIRGNQRRSEAISMQSRRTQRCTRGERARAVVWLPRIE